MDDTLSIVFPCERYPLKVISHSDPDLVQRVVEVVRVHVEDFDEQTLSLQPSRAGNYTSVRLLITARSETQLRALHGDLMALPEVKLVL